MRAIEYSRVLARRLTHEGVEYSNVIVEISEDGKSISITPFERETDSTPYESRPLQAVWKDGVWVLGLRL